MRKLSPKKLSPKQRRRPGPRQRQMTFLGHEDGWGDLYDATTNVDLSSPALASGVQLSIEPLLRAYEGVGLVKNTPVRESLRNLLRLMQARVVPDAEFALALDHVAKSLAPTLHQRSAVGSTVFAIMAGEKGEIKSNLWVFLRIMRILQGTCVSSSAWLSLARRVWIAVPMYHDSNDTTSDPKVKATALPPHPRRLVLADDCAYSGSQMANMGSYLTRDRREFNSVIMCPAFATPAAIERVWTEVNRISVSVPRLFGHQDFAGQSVTESVALADLALCMQGVEAEGQGWVVMSMFEVMGVLTHNVRTTKDPCKPWLGSVSTRQWFSGESIVASATLVGNAAVVFAHKVADTVSVPTRWFTLGATLRRAIDSVCPSMLCLRKKKLEVRVAVVSMRSMLEALDYDPKTPENSARRWAFRHEWLKPSCFMCSDAALAPCFAFAGTRPRVIDVSSMPVFCPLLQPVSACGQAFQDAHKDADGGGWWEMEHAESMTYNNAKGSARCITPQYKAKLQKRLKMLLAQGKAIRLCKALGVT